jgi:hypothetical protein
LPDRRAIIISKRLDIGLKIKILTLIILFVFNVPDPADGLVLLLSLNFPYVDACDCLLLNFVSLDPIGRDVLLVTSTNRTAFGFAYFFSCVQVAFSVEVGSEGSEVFGFDERVESVMGFTIDLVEGWFFFLSVEKYE